MTITIETVNAALQVRTIKNAETGRIVAIARPQNGRTDILELVLRVDYPGDNFTTMVHRSFYADGLDSELINFALAEISAELS